MKIFEIGLQETFDDDDNSWNTVYIWKDSTKTWLNLFLNRKLLAFWDFFKYFSA